MFPKAATVALLFVALLLPAVSGPGAQGHTGTSSSLIDVHKTIVDADTYMFSIRSTHSFNIMEGSTFSVTGFYGLGAQEQDSGAIMGIVKFINNGCPTASGQDPCFVATTTNSIKDTNDVAIVTQAPIAVSFERDPNAAQWGGGTVSTVFQGTTGFQKTHPSDDFVTFRFFASVPGAQQLKVDIHLHINAPVAVSIKNEVSHDGGFLFHGEDYAPAARVDTWPASAMIDGEAISTLEAGTVTNYTYAVMAPSWFGTTVVQPGATIAGTHNTAALSDFAVRKPDGSTHYGSALAVASPGDAVAAIGESLPGDYHWIVYEHAGIGPQDLYTVGFNGPIAG